MKNLDNNEMRVETMRNERGEATGIVLINATVAYNHLYSAYSYPGAKNTTPKYSIDILFDTTKEGDVKAKEDLFKILNEYLVNKKGKQLADWYKKASVSAQGCIFRLYKKAVEAEDPKATTNEFVRVSTPASKPPTLFFPDWEWRKGNRGRYANAEDVPANERIGYGDTVVIFIKPFWHEASNDVPHLYLNGIMLVEKNTRNHNPEEEYGQQRSYLSSIVGAPKGDDDLAEMINNAPF